VALPAAIRYGRTIPGCSGAVQSAFNNLSKITSKLGPVYEGNAILPGGSWVVSLSGRHYHFEQYALRGFRKCSLGAADACGHSRLMTAALQDLLDLRVEDKRCVAGAAFDPPAPTQPYDPQRASAGAVQNVGSIPVPNGHQLGLLQATMDAHSAVGEWRCGTRAAPPAGIVQKTHMTLEASATSEKQQHFFSMKAFSGEVDRGWSVGEVCRWAHLQDVFHHAWMEAVADGDWGHSRQAETDHQIAHICMGLRDERLLVRFSCGPSPISTCPVQTCEQALAGLPG